MKAILVLEMPKYCIDCPCHFAGMSTVVCGVKKKKLITDDIETYKPDWCPLKPMPSKKQEKQYCRNGLFGINTAMETSFNQGYNACIGEILGDKE